MAVSHYKSIDTYFLPLWVVSKLILKIGLSTHGADMPLKMKSTFCSNVFVPFSL